MPLNLASVNKFRIFFHFGCALVLAKSWNKMTLLRSVVDTKVFNAKDLVHRFAAVLLYSAVNIDPIPVLVCCEQVDLLKRHTEREIILVTFGFFLLMF